MKKVRKITRFIIDIILTILLVSYILINSVSLTIFNKEYVLQSLEKSDYYTNIHNLLISNFENYIQQSGLDDSVIKDIVTEEKIKKDSKQIITNIYDGFNEEISTEEIKQNLQNNINKSLAHHTISANEQKAIDNFINEICVEYKSTISSFEYDKQINSNYKKIVKYITLFNKIIIICIGLLVIILILLSLKRIYKFVVNIGISLFSAGVILTIINIYISIKVKIQHISILNDYISIVIRNIAADVIGYIIRHGIIFIISGLLLIAISIFWHNMIKYKLILKDIPEDN